MYCNGSHFSAEEEELSRAILSVTDIHMDDNGTIKQESTAQPQGTGTHGHTMNGDGDGQHILKLPPKDATAPVLRKAFDELLEEAKDCKEPPKQQLFIDAIKALLPRAAALGISVKYGKKVLQRLETVQPAKAALLAALTTMPMQSSHLEAALKLARPAACLLEPELLTQAEVGTMYVFMYC
jgi:hypothetical protein